jgi:hypothetical protein
MKSSSHSLSLVRERWSPAASAVVVCAVAIAVGSLLLTTYTLALGDPVPHRIDTAVLGDPRAHASVVEAIDHSAGGELALHPYPSVGAALGAIDAQQVYAALDLTQRRPSLYVASAAGASVARVLEKAAAATRVRVVDTHPLPPSDPQGLDVFYLMLVATILGFLTVFQVRANAAGLRLRGWTAFVVLFTLATSLTLTLVAGPILHRLALPILESWGILALQTLTVATFTSTMLALIGRWAIIPTFLLFVVLGNSSSGGAVAPPLLPPPLAIVSEWLPSGATVTAIREAVYFHGGQHVLPFAVLSVWAATWLGLMLAVSWWRERGPDTLRNRPSTAQSSLPQTGPGGPDRRTPATSNGSASACPGASAPLVDRSL